MTDVGRNFTRDAAHALRSAEEASERFYRRHAAVRSEVRREFNRHKPTLPTNVDFAVDVALGTDAEAQGALGDNRWHMARAQMYGQLAVVQQNVKIIKLLERLIELMEKK